MKTNHTLAHLSETTPREALRAALDHGAHLLPSQSPIGVFVHHNTLHALEYLPFEEAVIEGSKIYGCEPYAKESAFAAHIATGRILPRDIDAELGAHPELLGEGTLPGGISRRYFASLRLKHVFEIPHGQALSWTLDETDALRRLHPMVPEPVRRSLRESAQDRGEGGYLKALWRLIHAEAPTIPPEEVGARPRQWLIQRGDWDTDEWVHPLLIRLCAAFVDQGVAYWSMPGREEGFYRAVRALYALPMAPPDPWMEGLPELLQDQAARGIDAQTAALEGLAALGIPQASWGPFIQETLLALRGWAGLMAQLEERPDRAPVAAPPAKLMDFLAVRLTLERVALAYATAQDPMGPLGLTRFHPIRGPVAAPDLGVAYEAFVMAQIAGLTLDVLGQSGAAARWVAATAELPDPLRRRILHGAYERRHRVGVLDGLAAHRAMGLVPEPTPALQAIFCLDDREESLRRHLEEIAPGAQTFGYAGFFGIPMAYQGLEDVKPTPLCPVSVRPRHLIREVALSAEDAAVADAKRRRRGALRLASNVGGRTAVRGSVISATLGTLAMAPLIGRVLFPRLVESLHHRATQSSKPLTRLVIQRDEGIFRVGDASLLPGFTLSEMTDILEEVLRTLNLTTGFAPLVFAVGHGSSSLNNPHKAAYNCGAASGAPSGPNGRAFAQMANLPEVRRGLAERGIHIPPETVFIGGLHNTSSDALSFYDVDLLSEGHRAAFREARGWMDRARALDAHERSRRFEAAPSGRSAERALAHVEGRAADLGQARPEYGHATNAVFMVGRRALTRGLFLDRRAFLVSYDPKADPEGALLGPLLNSVVPVGAGINLEYYFSCIDNAGYGCGTKLPHNVTGLVGVMDGQSSDLRTGLPWQMVEIHEPVRLLTIVEADVPTLERIVSVSPGLAQLILGRWIQVVSVHPETGEMAVLGPKGFERYVPQDETLPSVASSMDYYSDALGHLGCARIEANQREVSEL